MERATLLGVVQQQIVIVQCPLLQGLPVQISLLISPVWMMAVKVSNQDCRMRKDWWLLIRFALKANCMDNLFYARVHSRMRHN